MTTTDSGHSCDPRTSPHCTKCCQLSTRSIRTEARSPVDRATRVRLPSGMMESTTSSGGRLSIARRPGLRPTTHTVRNASMLELTPLKNPLTISRHPSADVDITGGLKRGSNAGGGITH